MKSAQCFALRFLHALDVQGAGLTKGAPVRRRAKKGVVPEGYDTDSKRNNIPILWPCDIE
jgi:hypothetical protein